MEDLHKKWPHRWFNSKAEARKSKIHGIGVFAKKNIRLGEAVGVLGGVIVPKSDIKKYWKMMGHVGIQIDEIFFIVPTTREELERGGVFNHSCQPNLGFSNSITLIAIKNINAGDELVFDYAFNETTHSFKCNCGSAQCRGKIRPNDWQDPKLIKKYGRFYSPYLKKLIKL